MSAFSSIRPSLRLATVANQAARGFSSTAQRSIARMIITGRLAAEPELHATSSGQEIVRYAVGTSHGKGDNRQTSWFRVTSFVPEGGQRDYILGLQKGTLVYLEGDASLRLYEDAEGKKQSNLSIVQRKPPSPSSISFVRLTRFILIGSLEVLRRPQPALTEQ
ncbi:hypothetical protein N7492_000191 [Penicillium capsulatum]|uniref:SsDNA binding protein n=1 Tax=Penicillium capsulatum TaxID=69766 RepID=A0A9W9LYS3_9EURO|nr:hypothetical protein N7492_000191 [Penicillium capsulatum]KAJ6130744.1 hypothetical protein N7512_003524 [Penicillium capsulatum]